MPSRVLLPAGSAIMQNLVISLTVLDLLCTANASPKVVSMQLSRAEPRGLSKRNTVGVDVGNMANQAMYGVNVKVGNPPQPVTLLLDTGSSDTWMFGPKSCDTTTSPCVGGDCEYRSFYSPFLGKFHTLFAICLRTSVLKNIAQ
jgi:Eukaryotic aspartyl protease